MRESLIQRTTVEQSQFMGLAAFHLIFEEANEKNNMHKGTHFRARPAFSTAFSVT